MLPTDGLEFLIYGRKSRKTADSVNPEKISFVNVDYM